MNAEATLEGAILSIVEQDWPDLEYIVVDGASTDRTPEIIERYADRIASFSSEPDRGISDAFNKGLARSSGDLVIFTNSDDELVPGAVRQIAADWEALGRPDVLCGAIRYFDPVSGASFKETPDLNHLHRYMSVFHPAMVVTKQAYTRVGPYSEDYRLAMDCEWIHRALKLGLKIHASDSVYAVMRLQGFSDIQFRRALREFRRSAKEHGIYRFSTDLYYLQQLAFKSLMRLRWFKALKYRLDSLRKRKEWGHPAD